MTEEKTCCECCRRAEHRNIKSRLAHEVALLRDILAFCKGDDPFSTMSRAQIRIKVMKLIELERALNGDEVLDSIRPIIMQAT